MKPVPQLLSPTFLQFHPFTNILRHSSPWTQLSVISSLFTFLLSVPHLYHTFKSRRQRSSIQTVTHSLTFSFILLQMRWRPVLPVSSSSSSPTLLPSFRPSSSIPSLYATSLFSFHKNTGIINTRQNIDDVVGTEDEFQWKRKAAQRWE